MIVIVWTVLAGHSSTIHACTIEDSALVGMKATLLDGVTVGLSARQQSSLTLCLRP